MLKKIEENLLLSSYTFIKQRQYWSSKLSGAVLKNRLWGQLPAEKTQHTVPQVNKVPIKFPEQLSSRLLTLGKNSGVSIYIILLTALKSLLYRYNGNEENFVVSPVYKANVTGDTMNHLVLIYDTVRPGMSFKELLIDVRKSVLDAYENQDYPFVQLMDFLEQGRYIMEKPASPFLYCSLNSIHSMEELSKETDLRDDIHFDFQMHGDQLTGVISFDSQAIDDLYIRHMANHFLLLLGCALENIDGPVDRIAYLSPEEKELLAVMSGLTAWNESVEKKSGTPQASTLHSLICHQAHQSPDQIAVVFRDKQLSYGELNGRSNRLAQLLIEKGVRPNTIVAALLEPHIDMMTALLGILKAGCAYLPIDPDYPGHRIAYFLKESAVTHLVTLSDVLHRQKIEFNGVVMDMQSLPMEQKAEDPVDLTRPEDAAYLIYTSGSTGRPKAVLVEHRNVTAYLDAFQQEFKLNHRDRVLQQSSISFDVFVEEVYPVLVQGGAVVIPESDVVYDAGLLSAFMERNAVTLISCSPLMLNELNRLPVPASIHTFISGADVLKGEYVSKLVKHARVYNTYGPTESTVCASYYKVSDNHGSYVPIGKPIANYVTFILDSRLEFLPIGIAGQLCIAGRGVARGYLNNPELTAQRFVKNYPHSTSTTYPSPIYLTGDQARMLTDGNLQFLGRIDQQIKIRGYRIEPGEIENLLKIHDEIDEAVVTAREDDHGEKYLCAYYISSKTLGLMELNEYLSEKLPYYMIPSYFVPLDRLPLTPNGKIDLKALPAPETSGQDEPYIAPRNRCERKLVDIWSAVLGVPKEKIGIDSNFFKLGGHSLNSTILVSKIHQELDIRIPLVTVFNSPTIRALAAIIGSQDKDLYLSIPASEEKEYYPTSSAQKRLYVLQQMEPESTGYNMPQFMVLKGDTDRSRMLHVFNQLIRRHESLRTSLFMHGDQTVQKIHDSSDIILEIEEHSDTERFIRPFDLSHPPLMRIGMVKSGQSTHILMVDLHHTIADGASIGILIKEFTEIYFGKEPEPLSLRYRDFCEWQNSSRKRKDILNQQEYWLQTFEKPISPLMLPLDFQRPPMQSYDGAVYGFSLDASLTRRLRTLALTYDSTMFIVLLALWKIVLTKLSGQSDISVGTPTAGRQYNELQNLIGMFVNTLVLRSNVENDVSVGQFINQVKQNIVLAFDNQEYQYEDLVERVAPVRDTSRNPLFDVMFTFIDDSEGAAGIPEIEESGFNASPYKSEHRTSKFDLSLIAREANDRLLLSFEYCVRLFKQDTIQRFGAYVKELALSITKDSSCFISKLNILPDSEKQTLLHTFNGNQEYFDEKSTIISILNDQIARNSDHIALMSRPGDDANAPVVTFTYADLHDRVLQFAHYLLNQGVCPNDIVALKMERSVDMLLMMLAVIYTGAAYLPISPDFPGERVDYILKDSQAKLIDFPGDLNTDKPVLSLSQVNSGDMAYVMYTSGSTGRPKGVVIEHRNLTAFTLNMEKTFGITSSDRMYALTTFTFDISVLEMICTLLTGATVFIESFPENIIRVNENLTGQAITVMQVTPSRLGVLIDTLGTGFLETVRVLLVGGEALPQSLWDTLAQISHLTAINVYGPTETTIWSTCKVIEQGKVTVGKPLLNESIYILSPDVCLSPIGVTGEICIGGTGVGRGYLNRPELTSQRFIRTTQGDIPADLVIYRTGDLGRWLPGGEIECLGRIDHQVKIRGYRIECGEIENHLLKHEAIAEAAVIARPDDNQRYNLFAYIVTVQEQSIDLEGLREFLSRFVPQYMIPTYFMKLERMPLNSAGKIDRPALPDIENQLAVNYIPPSNEIEKLLAATWANILRKERVGVQDNFFHLGGDSIKAIQIAARLNQSGYKFEMKQLFQSPTISQLAPHVEPLSHIADQSEVTGLVPLTPIQRSFFYTPNIDYHHFNQSVTLKLSEGIGEAEIRTAFQKLVQHHDVLRTVFKDEHSEFKQMSLSCDQSKLFSLSVFDSYTPEQADTLHASIDLEEGPLVKLGLFPDEDTSILIIVIHHLVVDAYSWRILLQDLDTLLNQIVTGQSLTLPPKTDSFKSWSEALTEIATDERFLNEISYWKQLESLDVPDFLSEVDLPYNRIKDSDTISFQLSSDETGRLLTETHIPFNTAVNDVLLTALGLGLQRTFGQDKFLVALEAHGREPLIDRIDVNRTVGWFTSVYPIVLTINEEESLSQLLIETKESLRRIPHKGIGCGIIKYLTPRTNTGELEFNLKPAICFNYLGQFDHQNKKDKEESLFTIIPGLPQKKESPNRSREFLLDIGVQILGNRLSVSLIYNKNQFKTETIHTLMDSYRLELSRIIAHCKEQPVQLTPSDLTYKGLSLNVFESIQNKVVEQTGETIEDVYPLTPMQEGMLFHYLYENRSSAYFEQSYYRLNGNLNIKHIQHAIDVLFVRHDILRTVFFHEGMDVPLQVVLKKRKAEFYFEDIRSRFEPSKRDTWVTKFKAKDRQRSFDLSKDVLMRVSVIQTDDSQFDFVWSYHHILMDGWCTIILLNEFFEVYRSMTGGEPWQLPAVRPYRDYISWLLQRDTESSRDYWTHYLENFYDATLLSTFKTGNAGSDIQDYHHKVQTLVLEEKTSTSIYHMAANQKVTVNTMVQTVWAVLLGKYYAVNDVVFGAVVAGRPPEIQGIESMVGLFINTIPVRINWLPDTTFGQLLSQVQQLALESEPHHVYPLAKIQSSNHLKQSLLDHIMVFENYPLGEQMDGLAARNRQEQNLDMKVSGIESYEQTNYEFNIIAAAGKHLTLRFLFNQNLYSVEMVNQICEHFERVLIQVLENPECPVTQLKLMTQEQQRQLLIQCNTNQGQFPANKSLVDIFSQRVATSPENTTLVTSDMSLNGKQLAENVNRMAQTLCRKGVTRHSLVALVAHRSIETITAILAILKAGGAYLPIDPDNPMERIRFILEDSNVQLVLTQTRDISVNLAAFECIALDEEFKDESSNQFNFPDILPDDPAYVIYTSGSTGKPKGALVEHKSVVNILHHLEEIYPLGVNDTYLFKTNYTFDVSVTEILGWFFGKGRLAIPQIGIEKDPDALIQAIHTFDVTHINFVPSMLNVFIDMLDAVKIKKLESLKYIFVAGEAFTPSLWEKARQLKLNCSFENIFGPTEATIYTTKFSLAGSSALDRVPIGKPLRNVRNFILDRNLEPVPSFIPGELCIGGIGLARGYVNRPELTRQKFVKVEYNRFGCPRLYRTGDLARWLPDGNIECLGRMDHQVKVRGFRVELGEIENRLQAHPMVKEAVVLVSGGSSNRDALCAYIVMRGNGDIAAVKTSLSSTLPTYMIPAHFIPIDAIPLTVSGKVNRAALPEPGHLLNTHEEDVPETEVERTLLAIWEEVLDISPVGINDNFFEIGGDSIKLIQVSSRLMKYKLKLDVKEMFLYPTIRQSARRVKPMTRTAFQGTVTGFAPLTPVQHWFFENQFNDAHHFLHSMTLFRKEGFDESLVREVFKAITCHHDALRIVFPASARARGQEVRDSNATLFDLKTIQFKDDNKQILEAEAFQIQDSLDLVKGPLIKLGLFKTPQGDHLMITIHHLVVDGISWRIILEDFSNGYSKALNGEAIGFGEKTDSFKLWAEQLVKYASSPELAPQFDYWKSIVDTSIPTIARDVDIPINKRIGENRVSLAVELDAVKTEQLLREVNWAYGTEINDILLTALAKALDSWAGIKKTIINLEGHGREHIWTSEADLDVSRTVGWFTAFYPVILTTETDDSGLAIKQMKERIRRIPNKGIGYGILRYLSNRGDDLATKPEIVFNYLGQLDNPGQSGPENEQANHGTNLFSMSTLTTRDKLGLRMQEPYVLDINSLVTGGMLRVSFSYNKLEFHTQTIRRLSDCFIDSLSGIIDHCVTRTIKELTPSDMGYPQMELEELEILESEFSHLEKDDEPVHNRIRYIYPLSPMQGGMLFHALMHKDSQAFFEMKVFVIEGDLNLTLLEESFNHLAKRYDILRTIFRMDRLSEPLQLVLKQLKYTIQFEDISTISGQEQETLLTDYRTNEKKKGFDLEKGPLMRMILFKTNSSVHKLLWSYHHILMDGWCSDIIYSELLTIYRKLESGSSVTLSPPPSYRDYIEWLGRQDRQRGLNYWRGYLEGYDKLYDLSRFGTEVTESDYQPNRLHFTLDNQLTEAVARVVKDNRVTFSSFFETAWGVLLRKYNNTDDVVYGTIVSGRPPEVPGIETMIGLFINAIPVRVRGTGSESFAELLTQVHHLAIDTKPYEYFSLTDIQSQSSLKRSLFDHILAYENYPTSSDSGDSKDGAENTQRLRVRGTEAYGQSLFDLNIAIISKDCTFIQYNYNTARFEDEFIRNLHAHFSHVIHQVTENPDLELNAIQLVSPEESERVFKKMLYDDSGHSTEENMEAEFDF